jgi:cytochrome c peroxidase
MSGSSPSQQLSRSPWLILSAVWLVAALAVSAQQPGSRTVGGYTWELPANFPVPAVPADNPMSADKVALGKRLFFDTRLSANHTMACASCHDPAKAFTDGLAQPAGITGERLPRNAPSLVNVAYAGTLTWANPTLTRLEDQLRIPLLGAHPVEMGMGGREAELVKRLKVDAGYQEMFGKAFPDDPSPIGIDNLARAIASFERTIISGTSPFDRFRVVDDPNAITPSARRGNLLFFSARLGCARCHGGPNLGRSAGYGSNLADFFNIGLYNLGGTGKYPAGGEGVFTYTGKPEDMGRFKSPTLRNVALTAPYMHDGSVATLSEVIDDYAAGGRVIASGPYAGDGTKNPYKHALVAGFTLTPEQKQDLLAFLDALTDKAFLSDPRFKAPAK